jgi:hypothetical protein
MFEKDFMNQIGVQAILMGHLTCLGNNGRMMVKKGALQTHPTVDYTSAGVNLARI